MVGRDDRGMLVLEQRPCPDVAAADRVGDDGDVEQAFEQRLERPHRALDRDRHVNRRMLPAEGVDERRQPVIPGIALGADTDHAGLTGAVPPHVFLGRLDVVKDAPGGLEDAAAGGGHHHALADAEEQGRSQPSLDGAQLMTDRGLRQVQVSGRLRHASGRGHRRHHLEMPDFDIHE